jgi:hypothetical protein
MSSLENSISFHYSNVTGERWYSFFRGLDTPTNIDIKHDTVRDKLITRFPSIEFGKFNTFKFKEQEDHDYFLLWSVNEYCTYYVLFEIEVI